VNKTIKLSPSNVNSSYEKQILQTSYKHLKIFVASILRKGDHVRISKFPSVPKKRFTCEYLVNIVGHVLLREWSKSDTSIDNFMGCPFIHKWKLKLKFFKVSRFRIFPMSFHLWNNLQGTRPKWNHYEIQNISIKFSVMGI